MHHRGYYMDAKMYNKIAPKQKGKVSKMELNYCSYFIYVKLYNINSEYAVKN